MLGQIFCLPLGTELSRKKVRGQVLINILVDFIEKH